MLYLAANCVWPALIQISLMLLGWVVIYLCCHAIGHWLVGRLVGIRFQGYGVRGTDQPTSYPPGMRQIMSALPLLTIVTRKDSMAAASRTAKAFMFGAGEISSTLVSIGAAWYAWQAGLAGGQILLIAVTIWSTAALAASFFTPRGDFAKARNALRMTGQKA